jgi:hypothetical protein
MTNLPEETSMSDSHGVAGAHPDWLPPEINTNVAHPARVYDYWLGGKDNFPADRALAEHIMQAIPTMRAMARANRAFLSRSVHYLAAEAGVRQFLDIGTGIPTSPKGTRSRKRWCRTPGWCTWTTTRSCWPTHGH